MANKSEELRRVITRLLKLCCPRTYYEDANDEASYPYLVFSYDGQNRDQYPRDDNILLIDAWDKNKKWTALEQIADDIEAKLNMLNAPTDYVLPTFFMIDRKNVRDEDKTIKHIQMKFQIQNYYIGE